MMAVFSERQGGYRGGIVLFCIGVVVFIVGFATPYWTTRSQETSYGISTKAYNGLWEGCGEFSSGDSICVSVASGIAKIDKWYKAVQTLQCLALIGFILGGCYGGYVNLISKSRVFNRYVECAIGLSGVLGLIGAIVFAAKQAETQKDLDDIEEEYGDIGVDFQPVAWSFILDVIGCILTIVAAIIIAVFNKPLPANTASTTFAHSNPAAAPYIITYATNPQPAYIQGQPMAVSNGMNPPSYNQSHMKSQSPLGVAGGPPTSGAGGH